MMTPANIQHGPKWRSFKSVQSIFSRYLCHSSELFQDISRDFARPLEPGVLNTPINIAIFNRPLERDTLEMLRYLPLRQVLSITLPIRQAFLRRLLNQHV